MANANLKFTTLEGLLVAVKGVDNGDGTYSLATSGGGGIVTITGSIGGAVTVTSGHIVVDSGNINVSGTFWQTTQPTSDSGPTWTSSFGVTGACIQTANITGTTVITDAPTAGQKLVITDLLVSTDTAMNILFAEETSGMPIAKLYLPANGTVQWTPRSKMKLPTANKKLTAKASVTGNVSITPQYYSEA